MVEEKEYTLIFVFKGTQVLLGMKKRGFGAGKINAFGGKIEKGETNEQGAMRELEEESCLTAKSLKRIGYLVYNMQESGKLMKVHVYTCAEGEWTGEPAETEEMRPQWFETSAVPFDKMWKDDPYWFPLMLAGKSFVGRFDFSDEDTILDYKVTEQ